MAGKKNKKLRPAERASDPHPGLKNAPAERGYRYIGLLAAALGVLLYANTLGHDYCYDDSSAITENSLVRGGLKNIGAIFTTNTATAMKPAIIPVICTGPCRLPCLRLSGSLCPTGPASTTLSTCCCTA